VIGKLFLLQQKNWGNYIMDDRKELFAEARKGVFNMKGREKISDADVCDNLEPVSIDEIMDSREFNICDVCGNETAACLILCPDCNEQIEGALKELELMNDFLEVYGYKTLELTEMKSYVKSRIKKLKGSN